MVVLGRGRVQDNGGVGKREGSGQWWCWEEGGLRTMMLVRGRVKDNDVGRGRVKDNDVGKREG